MMQFGLPGAAFLVLLVLKLTHLVSISWWWVTAPLWGVAAAAAVLTLMVAVVKAWADRPARSRKRAR